MRKQLPELPELTEEELATEIIELTCDEVDSLSRAFQMISELCEQLQCDVLAERLDQVPKNRVN